MLLLDQIVPMLALFHPNMAKLHSNHQSHSPKHILRGHYQNCKRGRLGVLQWQDPQNLLQEPQDREGLSPNSAESMMLLDILHEAYMLWLSNSHRVPVLRNVSWTTVEYHGKSSGHTRASVENSDYKRRLSSLCDTVRVQLWTSYKSE